MIHRLHPDDGPIAPDGFRYGGEVFDGLKPGQFRLLDYAWPRTAVDIADLPGAVWEDPEGMVTVMRSTRWCFWLNGWLANRGLPYGVKVKNRAVTLYRRSDREIVPDFLTGFLREI